MFRRLALLACCVSSPALAADWSHIDRLQSDLQVAVQLNSYEDFPTGNTLQGWYTQLEAQQDCQIRELTDVTAYEVTCPDHTYVAHIWGSSFVVTEVQTDEGTLTPAQRLQHFNLFQHEPNAAVAAIASAPMVAQLPSQRVELGLSAAKFFQLVHGWGWESCTALPQTNPDIEIDIYCPPPDPGKAAGGTYDLRFSARYENGQFLVTGLKLNGSPVEQAELDQELGYMYQSNP